MPSPGGKGGNYQRPPTPFGYGQPTFAPQQFAGYGQPSNIFSFNNPHYQPYNPNPIQQPYNPNTGNTGNPMTPTPEVTAQPVDQSAAMRDQIRSLGQEGLQSGAVTRDMLVQAGYANPDEILANANPVQSKPPAETIQLPPEPQAQILVPPEAQTPPDFIYDRVGGYNPDEFRVFDPYGPGGAFYGQPRPTFPDPTQPQGPQGTVQGAPMNMPNLGGKGGYALEQLRNPDVPLSRAEQEQNYLSQFSDADRQRLGAQSINGRGAGDFGPVSGQGSTANMVNRDIGSGIGSLFNLQSLMSPGQPTTGNTGLGLGATFNSQQLAQRMQGMVGGPSPMQSPDLIARDRAAYAANRGGYNIAGQYDPNMPPGYGTTYQTLI